MTYFIALGLEFPYTPMQTSLKARKSAGLLRSGN